MRRAQQTRSLVAAWFDFLPPAGLPVAQALHRAVKAAAPDLGETVRQGNLLWTLYDEPLMAIAPDVHQLQLLIYNGSSLDHHFGPLDGVGRRQRMMRFPLTQPVDSAHVATLARASVDAARRLRGATGD